MKPFYSEDRGISLQEMEKSGIVTEIDINPKDKEL